MYTVILEENVVRNGIIYKAAFPYTINEEAAADALIKAGGGKKTEIVDDADTDNGKAGDTDTTGGTETDDAPPVPFDGYDDMTVTEIQAHLEGASAEEVEAVRAYERVNKARVTLLED